MANMPDIFTELWDKCHESGVDPQLFLQEKLQELQERKRILLTPTKSYFSANRNRYNDVAAQLLRRQLSEEEIHHPEYSLTKLLERRFTSEPRPAVDPEMKRTLLRESNGRCVYCGEFLTLETMRVDHRVPVSEGGSSHTLNLQALCQMCNAGKSSYSEETASAAARPWYEQTSRLAVGNVDITPTKRVCVLIRDRSRCWDCGGSAAQSLLMVVLRVRSVDGGQPVYDNLVTRCEACIDSP